MCVVTVFSELDGISISMMVVMKSESKNIITYFHAVVPQSIPTHQTIVNGDREQKRRRRRRSLSYIIDPYIHTQTETEREIQCLSLLCDSDHKTDEFDQNVDIIVGTRDSLSFCVCVCVCD